MGDPFELLRQLTDPSSELPQEEFPPEEPAVPEVPAVSGQEFPPDTTPQQPVQQPVTAVPVAPVSTGPDISLKRADRGSYTLEESDLPESEKMLLHGRAFVVDMATITATSSGSPETEYIAYDSVQGLVVPARSMSIKNNGPGNMHYRWSDDGEKFTAWITLEEGESQDYATVEKCRFAEVQVYANSSGTVYSLRATR